MAQALALNQTWRLLTDPLMRWDCLTQIVGQAFLRGGAQMRGLVESVLGFLGQMSKGAADRSALGFGVAYQLHEDFRRPPALAAKAAQDLLKVLVEPLGVAL